VKRISRLVSLCGIFCPRESDRAIVDQDRSIFEEFCIDARSHVLRAEQRKIAREKTKFREFVKVFPRVANLICEAFKEPPGTKDTSSKIQKLVPEREIKLQIFEVFKTAITAKPTDIAKRKEEINRMEIDLARRGKLLKAKTAITNGLFALSAASQAGDADAAEGLAEAAILASRLLRYWETFQPELSRRVAKLKVEWPVLATSDTGWEKEAVRRIAELGVGDDLVRFKARFRAARGCDENLPARRWAKAAVRTIEETRFRLLRFELIARDFGSIEALTDFGMERGWHVCPGAKWARKICTIRRFTKASKGPWSSAIREMIREQIPDFHTRGEWQNQRNAAKESGRETKGLVQNRILDDICDALESIAPNL
jgi:hypothetical protein